MPNLPRKSEDLSNALAISGGDEDLEELHMTDMASAMSLARERVRTVNPEENDPDPYGYAQELENEYGVDLVTPNWKAKPDDPRWVARLKARSRKAAVARLWLLGHTTHQIAAKVKVSEWTVLRDLKIIGQEWRRSYLNDIEELASRDLARLDYMFMCLAPAIERGDTKAIVAGTDIINKRANILGYHQGVQVDYTQQITEIADAHGFDPERALTIAKRLTVTYK